MFLLCSQRTVKLVLGFYLILQINFPVIFLHRAFVSEVVSCWLHRHILSLSIVIIFNSNQTLNTLFFGLSSAAEHLYCYFCCTNFSTSDPKEDYRENSSLSPLFSQLTEHGWMFFLGQKGFFKCNTKVAATSFSHEEREWPRRVSYYPFTTPLSQFWSVHPESTPHNAAWQYTIHSLNTVNS